MAFQCLAGRLPFRCDSLGAYVHAHLYLPPPALHGYRGDLSSALDGVLGTGMAKSPADRFPSCTALVDALAAAPAAHPPDATRVVPPPDAPRASGPSRRPHRGPLLAAAASALVVTLVIGGVQLLGSGPGNAPAQPPPVPARGTVEVAPATQV